MQTGPRRWPWGLPAAIALVVGIALLDHATGVAVRTYPLYFLPIALAAWSTPRFRGVLLPVLATLGWVVSNQPEGSDRDVRCRMGKRTA